MQLPGSAAIPRALPRPPGDGLSHRQAHRRDGRARTCKPSRHPDPRGLPQRHRGQFGAMGGSTNAPIHLEAIARHIGVELASTTGRPMGRTFRCWSICSRPANIWARTIYHAGGVPAVVDELMQAGPDLRGRPDRQRQDLGDNCRGCEIEDDGGDPPVRAAAQGQGRLHRAARQSVRQRDDEDQRHLRGVPRPLPVRPGRSRRLRGPGRGVRRAGGLSRADRRSGAGDRRATRCWSCAAPGRSAIRGRRKW